MHPRDWARRERRESNALVRLPYRAPRPQGHQKGGAIADEDHQFAERPRDLQRRRPEEASLLLPHLGEVAGAPVAVRAGPAEDLLPEAGGPGPGAPADREHVRVQPSLLNRRENEKTSQDCKTIRLNDLRLEVVL